MSYAAVYNVTRGLRMLLHSQLVQVSSSAVVTLLPPGDALPDASGVNLYLYRVTESPFTRNQAWPGDRTTPPSDKPPLGLMLSYLMTPLATKPDNASFQQGDDAHTMLGIAMLALQENPVLNDVHIPGFDADAVLPDFLLNSYEQVKINLVSTSIEELSKIWATINQPYRLSVAYDVSLVELTPTLPPPVGGGRVLSTGVNVIAFEAPRIGALTPSQGRLAHVAAGVVTGDVLQISGSGLSLPGQQPVVRVGGQPVSVMPSPAPTDTQLSIQLPTELDAGPDADVSVTLNGRTGTPVVFSVKPWVSTITPIRTALDSTRPSTDLKLALQGNGFTPTPQGVRFDGPGGTTTVTTFDAGGTDGRAIVTTPATLANGVYRVRIVLADSSASNARTLEVIPLVNSPIGVATVTVSGASVHQLTLQGARLNGNDVRLTLDGVSYLVGVNTTAGQVQYTLGRLLEAGTHSIAVSVDGSMSRSVAFVV
jgi:hypothetical protein